MIYNIVYDKQSRLRIRLGSQVFNSKEGYGLAQLISSKNYVKSVVTSHLNGGILIEYEDRSYRKDLIKFLNSITRDDFDEVEPTEIQSLAETDSNFYLEFVGRFVKRYIKRVFFPTPIKQILAVYHGIPYAINGLRSLLQFKTDVALLDGVAITASLANKSFKSASSAMFLLGITDLFEEYTMKKTKDTLKNSLAINIDNVWLVKEDGTEISYPLSMIKKGDIIKVRTGELIPVDGKVIEGEAMVNEASMTGEPLAIQKYLDKTVHAGTVVEEGIISIEVYSANNETRINKIIDLIENSESLKASVQSKAETLADKIVPYSLIVTLLTYLISRNTQKALSVLMVDFSCAIKLATPLTVMSTMHEASEHKILVKGGKHLESFALADTIIFDKTGTLTHAVPKVVDVIPTRNMSRDELLKMAACIEEHYAHSVARAIVNKAEEEGLIHEEEHAEVEYIVAHGIATKYNDKRVIIGSRHFIVDDENVKFTKKEEKIVEENVNKYSVIYLAIDGKLEGIICIDDPVREESIDVISDLKKLGIKNIVMLTGDSENSARFAAETLGITDYRSQILPEDKFKVINDLKDKGRKVIMVGDGINDSPALAVADVSVAMSNSSDIAREVADISLINDDLHELVTLRKLSMAMLDRINDNYRNIVIVNSSIICLGILGIFNESMTSISHNLSTMIIGALSTRSLLN